MCKSAKQLTLAAVLMAIACVTVVAQPFSPADMAFLREIQESGLGCLDPATDNFNRADGALGNAWSASSSSDAGNTLVISGNVVTPLTENEHTYAIYTNSSACVASNQWSQIKLSSIGPWTGTILRAAPATDAFYMAFVFAANDYRFYLRLSGQYYQYYQFTTFTTWHTNDVFTFYVFEANPVRMYMYQNSACVGAWLDWTNLLTTAGGQPGIGIYSPVGQHLTLDNWQGGSVPIYTGAFDDAFGGVNGLLGTNWISWPLTGAYGGLQLSSGTAIGVDKGGGVHDDAAIWAVPVGANCASEITLNSQGSSDYAGALARCSYNNTANTWYAALVVGGLPTTTLDLFAFDGTTYHLLATDTTDSWVAGDRCRIEATGTSPVALTVKKNGVSVLTFSDATYKYTGTRCGMSIFDSGDVPSIAHWTGTTL